MSRAVRPVSYTHLVRTFEAAAYLRRAGAESSDVKRLFQSSFDQYMERQKLISSARDCGQGVIFAITGEERCV